MFVSLFVVYRRVDLGSLVNLKVYLLFDIFLWPVPKVFCYDSVNLKSKSVFLPFFS